jgi:Tfp pilus assembly protein PilO
MIDQMSPLSRRIVAVGLLVLLVLLLVQYVLAPLASAIVDQRDALTALRARETRLQATARRTLPNASDVQPGQAIIAPSPSQGAQRLQALLAGKAALAGVSVQLGPPCAPKDEPALLCADLAVSGTEADMARFLNSVEHGAPVIRFRMWQLTPGQGVDTQLHFNGRAVAVWQKPV